ncbi:MAG: hypothetical protein LC104_19125, partial [Bacteroidales bacterium]|nr:hypothetical protein [Bacteroidales bacterium]
STPRVPPLTLTTPASGSGAAVSVTIPHSPHRFGLLLWVILAACALGIGFAAHVGFRATFGPPTIDPDSLPLTDLRVIERLPLYLGVDDLAFLQTLEESNLFPVVGMSHGTTQPNHPFTHPEPPVGDREALIRLFLSYPPARRQQLRQLDEDLSAWTAEQQRRYAPVLERYALWLDRLPDPDRHAVLAEPDSASRLTTIRRVREKQWRESLPTRQREELKLTADPEETVRLITAWKEGEQARNTEWELARQNWDELNRGPKSRPWPFGEPTLAQAIDEYIRHVLKADLTQKTEGKFDLPSACRLDRSEFLELKNRQEAAQKEGYWLLYGACLLRLAERHPYLPPPQHEKPLTELHQVSKEFLKEIRARRTTTELGRMRGRWPEFALELQEAAYKAHLPMPSPLGPATLAELSPALREFVQRTLTPALTEDERQSLRTREGQWPAYPRRLIELSDQHDFSVPGITLPGPPSRWRKLYGTTHRVQ